MEKSFIYFVLVFCGVSALSFDSVNRISNGNEANIIQFPYSVSIQRIAGANTEGRGHKCGGVLVSLQHVLTAASCLFDIVNGSFVAINPAEYRVFGGATQLTADNEQNRIRSIENVTIHPEYIHPPASLNNIGIITLRTPFLNTTVSAISLPVPTFDPADFTLCQVAGWGAENSSATASSTLRFTSKYIYSQSLCEMVYSQMAAHPNIFNSMVCAASFDIVSSGCTGDEGNALVCSGGLTGVLFQTNDCAVSSYPEVYTRISNYTTWIRSITGGSATIRPDLTLFAILAIITAKFLSR